MLARKFSSEGESRCPRRVARQKRHFMAFQFADDVVVRRRAERGFDVDFLLCVKPRHGVKSAAADDADSGQISAPFNVPE